MKLSHNKNKIVNVYILFIEQSIQGLRGEGKHMAVFYLEFTIHLQISDQGSDKFCLNSAS